MLEIKYKVNPSNWLNVIDTMNVIVEWSQVTYKELEEGEDKFILIQFLNNDLETAFYIGTLLGDSENNKNLNKK